MMTTYSAPKATHVCNQQSHLEIISECSYFYPRGWFSSVQKKNNSLRVRRKGLFMFMFIKGKYGICDSDL